MCLHQKKRCLKEFTGWNHGRFSCSRQRTVYGNPNVRKCSRRLLSFRLSLSVFCLPLNCGRTWAAAVSVLTVRTSFYARCMQPRHFSGLGFCQKERNGDEKEYDGGVDFMHTSTHSPVATKKGRERERGGKRLRLKGSPPSPPPILLHSRFRFLWLRMSFFLIRSLLIWLEESSYLSEPSGERQTCAYFSAAACNSLVD